MGAESGCGCSCGNGGPQPTEAMPQVTFSTFVLSLCSSAMVHLGEVPEPSTGQLMEDRMMAKHTIDILTMLKEKTAKCLDESEAKLLDDILYELRMKYVAK